MAERVLQTLLVNSLVFAVLFAAVALVRALLGRRLSAGLSLALWAVLAVKLLLPFGFESALSPLAWLRLPAVAAMASPAASAAALAAASPAATAAAVAGPQTVTQASGGLAVAPIHAPAQPQVADTGEGSDSWLWGGQPQQGGPYGVDDALPGAGEVAPNPADSAPPAVRNPVPWTLWVLLVWASGAVGVALWLALGHLALRRHLRAGLAPPPQAMQAMRSCCRELGIRRPVELRLLRGGGSPAIAGLLRPVVLVDEGVAQDATALRPILIHELSHYRSGDLWAIFGLNLLTVVYWFHPLVWALAALARRDMETRCDQRVLALLTRQDQQYYVNTLLHFAGFGAARQPRVVLGMGVSRKTMERRIRDMFRSRRADGLTRWVTAGCSVLMLCVGLLSACMPPTGAPQLATSVVATASPTAVPDAAATTATTAPAVSATPAVVPADTPTAAPTATAFPAPARLKYDIKGAKDNFIIQVDADVQVPASGMFPIVKVTADTFSQELVDRVRQALLPGVPLYQPSDTVTKGQLQTLIDYYKEEYDAAVKGGYKAAATDYRKMLKDLKAKQTAAPDTVALQPADMTLRFNEDFNLRTLYGHEVVKGNARIPEWTEAEKQQARDDGNASLLGVTAYDPPNRQMALRARTHKPGVVIDGLGQFIDYNDYDTTTYRTPDVTPNADGMTQDDAISKAEALLQKIGVDFELQSVQLRQYPADLVSGTKASSHYVLNYLRNVGATAQRATVGVHLLGMQEYVPPYAGEHITIMVDNSGILKFNWEDPVRIDSVESSSAPLLSFDQIQAIADKQLKSQELALPLNDKKIVGRRIVISQITLSSMPVRINGQPASYRYVPVWDFNGMLIYRYAKGTRGIILDANNERVETGAGGACDAQMMSFATINAIDGSVIDRTRGY